MTTLANIRSALLMTSLAVAVSMGGAGAGWAAQPEGTIAVANISLAQANKVIEGAVAYAVSQKVAISVVVVDTSGYVVAAARMDGVPFGSFDVARGKAIASAATGGVSGKELLERFKANSVVFGQISSLSYGGPMFPAQGSLPIFKDGVYIGSVGASAASSQMDEDAGRAGIRALGASEVRK